MNLVTLLPFIVLIGAMFLMTRSAKNKQRQAASMRNQMVPGTGIRTIGGMYATVKEVHEDTILVEVAPGVHAVYAKNAVGAVLEDAEYNRIVHGIDPESADGVEDAETADDADAPVVPDDVSSLTDAEPQDADKAAEKGDAQDGRIDLGKKDAAEPADEPSEQAAEAADDSEDGKRDKGTDAK